MDKYVIDFYFHDGKNMRITGNDTLESGVRSSILTYRRAGFLKVDSGTFINLDNVNYVDIKTNRAWLKLNERE